MRHGKKYRVSLVDGSTIEGTHRFSWGWWSFRLVDCMISDPKVGSVETDGFFIIPRASILLIQAVSD